MADQAIQKVGASLSCYYASVVSAAYSGVDIKILFMDIMPAAVAEKDDEQKP